MSGIENYYKIGFNSQSFKSFKKRYHTYIGEFNFLKYNIYIEDVEAAIDAGFAIEKLFKEQNESNKAYPKYELYIKENEGKDMLPTYKRSLAMIITKLLFDKVRCYPIIFLILNL